MQVDFFRAEMIRSKINEEWHYINNIIARAPEGAVKEELQKMADERHYLMQDIENEISKVLISLPEAAGKYFKEETKEEEKEEETK